MKRRHSKNITKKTKNKDIKKKVINILNQYNITGIKEYKGYNFLELEHDSNGYTVMDVFDDKVVIIHGDIGTYSKVDKYEIMEDLDNKMYNHDYEEIYPIKVIKTEYTDNSKGINVKKIIDNITLTVLIEEDMFDEEMMNLKYHLYDYKLCDDPIVKKWALDRMIRYFSNENIDYREKRSVNNSYQKVKK